MPPAPREPLTDEEIEQIKDMYGTVHRGKRAWTVRSLARKFNCSRWHIEKHVATYVEIRRKGMIRRHRAEDTKTREPRALPPPPVEDTRPFTARFCGDPMPGRSALDQRTEPRDPLALIGRDAHV